MPELPDVTVYLEHLDRRVVGAVLERIDVWGMNLLRSADPPLETAYGRRVLGMRRVGKRIVFVLEAELSLVLHLMVAGRLHWRDAGAPVVPVKTRRGRAAAVGVAPEMAMPKRPRKIDLAEFLFSTGALRLTEASSKQRASLHLVAGEAAVEALDPGGIEVMESSVESFEAALKRETHTLKRALTDPRTFSGIGNAYSDEILHRAKLSPLRLTSQLDAEEVRRLHAATIDTLQDWTDRLRALYADTFPEKVTAFRDDMAVHGRYRQPCPVCGAPVQRIVYADRETNYCARCQTGGRLLADRSMSRLLRGDWPKTLEEMEG